MDLLILGASARSAAFSALRIGLRPACVDLFADLDLASICPATRVEPADYPDGLAAVASQFEPTPWLYTGAIENWPDLVDRISRRHPLLGNPGPTLRAVRDPIALTSAVRGAGLVAPEVRLDPKGLPVDGSWLVKPLASGGGRGIRPWSGGREASGRVYFQERVEGLPLAAQFVGNGSGARYLGITRQFVGRPGSRYAYRGSLGPWPVGAMVEGRIDALGRSIAGSFGLVGLFGIDLILRDDQPWPIEVNPRYTASVEVLEWASGTSLLLEHIRASKHLATVNPRFASTPHPNPPSQGVRGLEFLPPPLWGRARVGGRGGPELKPIEGQVHRRNAPGAPPLKLKQIVGKAILYAESAFRWPPSDSPMILSPSEFPESADLPRPGMEFRPGDPVLTVFARGDSPETCRRELASRLRAWRRRLRPGC